MFERFIEFGKSHAQVKLAVSLLFILGGFQCTINPVKLDEYFTVKTAQDHAGKTISNPKPRKSVVQVNSEKVSCRQAYQNHTSKASD